MKLFRIGLGLLMLGFAVPYAHGADIKISALPDGGTVQTTDQIPTNRGGTTNRVVVGFLATQGALSGDCTTPGNSGVLTCTKLNGTTPGGTCTNQTVTSLSTSAVPTCTTLTSAYVDTSIAKTGTDVNTSNQVTATHLAAPLPATQGGTGQTTITLGDLLYGSASNVLSKLGGNTSATKQFLTQTGNGTISAAPAWGALASGDIPNLGANPSGTIGLSAVNGSATTYVRSDGAPALSQAIVPTWTGIHTWSLAEPRQIFSESDQGTDLKNWDWDLNAGVFCLRTRTDADGAGVNVLCVTRGATTAITNITFGNATSNPTFTYSGSGNATYGGSVTAGAVTSSGQGAFGRVNLTNTVVPAVGFYNPAANQIGFSVSTTNIGTWDATQLVVKSGVSSAGTKFTAAGCSNSTTVGGAIAGSFVSGTTGTCTVVITLPTATNGWVCRADDLTTPANFIGQSASSTTSCTITGTTVTGDVLNFSAIGF